MHNFSGFRVARSRIVVGGLLLSAASTFPVALAGADAARPRVLLAKNAGADKDLSRAIEKDDVAAAKAALDAGADATASDKGGQSPLMWAAKSGKVALVALLLARGSNANAQDKGGHTALMLATQFGAPAPEKPKKGLGGIMGRIKKQVGEDIKGKLGGSLDARLGGLGKVGSSLMGNVPLHRMLGENVDLLMAGKGLKLGSVSNWKAIAGTALVGDAQAGGTIGVVPVLSGNLRLMGAGDWSKLVRGVDKANPQVMKAMKYIDTEDGAASQKWTKFVGLAQNDDQKPMAQMLTDPVLQPLIAEARTNLMSAVSELPGQRIYAMASGLLGAGADAALTNKEGRSALDMAQERELASVVSLLQNPAENATGALETPSEPVAEPVAETPIEPVAEDTL